jgi:signal peptidase II
VRPTLPRNRWLSYAIAALTLAIDQLSKAWAVSHLAHQGQAPLLPGLLDLQLTYNTGAAFSLLTGFTGLLGLVSVLVALGLVVWLQRHRQLRAWQAAAAGLLLGGALGNGIDRWRIGAVVDFLALVPVSFPVFNLADVAINAAVACFLIDQLLALRRP